MHARLCRTTNYRILIGFYYVNVVTIASIWGKPEKMAVGCYDVLSFNCYNDIDPLLISVVGRVVYSPYILMSSDFGFNVTPPDFSYLALVFQSP